MNGILPVNKPSGITSHDMVYRARRALGCRKIGHAGTLDPMASGVLILLVGRATRLSDYLLNKEKTYRAGILLGTETDTYDLDGTVLRQTQVAVSEAEFLQALDSFLGTVRQLPPMYSAIKKNGKKLYELARAGIEVERETREVTFFSVRCLSFAPPHAVVEIECSKGTYIRSFAHDLGEKLGCGACLESLIRTKAGQFSLEDTCSAGQLEAGEITLLPTESALPYPSVTVVGEQERKLRNGNEIHAPFADGTVKIFAKNGDFLCTASVQDGRVTPITMFLEEKGENALG